MPSITTAPQPLLRGRRGARRRRRRTLHARQACEAPGAFLDLATALRCHRLLPEEPPASRLPTSITLRIRTTRACFGGMPKQPGATIELPFDPANTRLTDPSASPWDPLFLSYIANAEGQLLDGAPHHLRKRFQGVDRNNGFKWHFVEHHLAHEASAFLAAPLRRHRRAHDGRPRRRRDDQHGPVRRRRILRGSNRSSCRTRSACSMKP